MVPQLFIIKAIILSAIVALVGYLGFDKIHSIGYAKAETKYKEQIEVISKDLQRRSLEVELLSNSIELDRLSSSKQLKQSLDSYLVAFRAGQKPVTIINDTGECRPSAEFAMAFNEIVRRANAPSNTSSAPK